MELSVKKGLTFLDHISELRSRLFWSLFSFFIGGIIGFLLNSQILAFLISPLSQPLFYSSPAGGFDFVFKLSIFFGFVISIPVFTYHVIKFIEPVLSEHFHVFISRLLIASCLLTASGILFAYYLSLPAALHFLNQFGSDKVRSLISATEYFSFVTAYIAGFAILFQLPLVLFLINRVTPLKPGQLMKRQQYVILVSFIIAAILTPTPDVLNQTIMALPLIGLYQVSILIIWVSNYMAHVKKEHAEAASVSSRSRLNRSKLRKLKFFQSSTRKLNYQPLIKSSYS